MRFPAATKSWAGATAKSRALGPAISSVAHPPQAMMLFNRASLVILVTLATTSMVFGTWTLGNIAPQTFVEPMTVKPIFSPDNSLYYLKKLIDSANVTLEVQNQYILKWSGTQAWLADGNPIMQAIYAASQRGVSVRVILEGTVDSDAAGAFLTDIGIPTRYIGTGLYNHIKGVIVDSGIVAVMSINLGKTSLTQNREAGAIVYSPNVAQYFLNVFNYDWANGTTPSANGTSVVPSFTPAVVSSPSVDYASFTKVLNMTAFTNPDNNYAYNLFVNAIAGTRYYFHAVVYQFTQTRIATAILNMLSAHPGIDCGVVLSSKRVGTDNSTNEVQALYNAGCNAYSSNSSLQYTHAKFWTFDNQTCVFSGNWAATSLTSSSTANSYGVNREWGLLINDWYFQDVYNKVFVHDALISTLLFSPAWCTASYDACGVCGGSNSTCPADFVTTPSSFPIPPSYSPFSSSPSPTSSPSPASSPSSTSSPSTGASGVPTNATAPRDSSVVFFALLLALFALLYL